MPHVPVESIKQTKQQQKKTHPNLADILKKLA